MRCLFYADVSANIGAGSKFGIPFHVAILAKEKKSITCFLDQNVDLLDSRCKINNRDVCKANLRPRVGNIMGFYETCIQSG